MSSSVKIGLLVEIPLPNRMAALVALDTLKLQLTPSFQFPNEADCVALTLESQTGQT